MTSQETAAVPLRILFAGGGTGGHLYPGIAIAEEIRKRLPSAELLFLGNRKNIEARIVPGKGFSFFPIRVAGFRRSLSFDTLLSLVKLIVAVVQSFLLIRRLKPKVVVGTGGYVCGPPLYVASLVGIPTLIQEQNSYPGVTTRILASRVSEVHLSFDRARRYIKRTEGVFVSGNPTREAIGCIERRVGAEHLHVDDSLFTVLVVGGSRGARSINDAILGMVDSLAALGMQLVWGSGGDDYERCRTALEGKVGSGAGPLHLLPYIEEMEFAYAVADLVVCRAGATTIAEITRAGLPSVLIPYPFAAADHQTENAKALEEAGAAAVVPDAETGAMLLPLIRGLLHDPARLKAMGDRARQLGAPRATEILADAVLRLAGG